MSDSEEESQNAVEQVERRAKKDSKIKAKGVVHKTEHAVFSKTKDVVETCEHGVHMTKNFVRIRLKLLFMVVSKMSMRSRQMSTTSAKMLRKLLNRMYRRSKEMSIKSREVSI